jgi:hypothetical protein
MIGFNGTAFSHSLTADMSLPASASPTHYEMRAHVVELHRKHSLLTCILVFIYFEAFLRSCTRLLAGDV